jgi:hypothetical protein
VFGPYVFAQEVYNGICEVCHAGTNYDAPVPPPDSTNYLQYFRPWEGFVNPFTISGAVDTLDGVVINGLPINPVTKGGGLYSATVGHGWLTM